MNRRFGWACLVAVVAVLTLTLSNCAPQQSSSGSGQSAQASTLVFGAVGDPVTLESGNVIDGYSIYPQQQIYDRLLDFKPGTADLMPGLATEWSSSNDGRTWTFKLREGVKFQDDTPFNAEAVRANVNRWWDPNDPLSFRNAGKTYEIWVSLFGGFKGSEASLLQDIQVIDANTIQFVLKQPFAAFPAAIASAYFGIASPTALQKAGADYGRPNTGAVGTGPFQFVEWKVGDRLVLRKNPNYWKAGLPKSEQVIFRTIKESTARLAELRTGTIDFTENLSPEQQAELQQDANVKPVRRPSFNVGYLALNPSYTPLAKREVRQAIAQAIHKQAMVGTFWRGLATTDGHFTPPAMQPYQDPSITDYEYNPEQAKRLLAQAGYPNGFDLDLWYAPINGAAFPTPKLIAEAWVADLKAVGINVTLNTKDWAAYLADRLKPPGFQAFMLSWVGDYGDPDNFYSTHFAPGSTADIGNWTNDRLTQLLTQARQTPDETTRRQQYAEVDRLLFEEVLRIPIVHAEPLLGRRSNLSGWIPSPLGSESFAAVIKSP